MCAPPGLSRTLLRAGCGWGHGWGKQAVAVRLIVTITHHKAPSSAAFTYPPSEMGRKCPSCMSELLFKKHSCFLTLLRPLPALASPVASVSCHIWGQEIAPYGLVLAGPRPGSGPLAPGFPERRAGLSPQPFRPCTWTPY